MKNYTLISAVCLLLISTASLAQPGSLDPTFSQDGIKKTNVDNFSGGHAVAIQADGKIVVGGGDVGFTLLRYNPDGILDFNFGKKGIVTSNFGFACFSIAIKSDGSILAAGIGSFQESGYSLDFLLVQYKPDGSLDTGFGINGKAKADFGFTIDYAFSVALQPDGKIVVGGFTTAEDDSYDDFAIVRYNADGNPDSTFGTNGKVITDLTGGSDQGFSVAIDANGNILLAGAADYYGRQDFGIVRYKNDGTPDNGFGVNGIVLTNFDGHDVCRAFAIQPDGKIVAAGYSNRNFALARYHNNGQLDNSFSKNGKVITKSAGNSEIYSIAMQPDGKIVAAGIYYAAGGIQNFALARYNVNGTLDMGFGNNGKTSTNVQDDDYGRSVALQSDGKIVVAGFSNYNEFSVARYNGDNASVVNNIINNYSGIQKQNISTIIHLFPNPVKDVLHIAGLSSSTKTISVIDANGKLLQQTITANSNHSFNIKQLAAGIYFIRIVEGDKSTKLKFIKE